MAALQPGLNEIRISVMDEGGWAGLNYKLTLTGDAATPPSTIPAGTVPDTTPPVLTVPDPITVACSAVEGISSSNPLIQAWLGQATATDAQDGSVAVLNNAPTTCVLGDNMVTFEAYDTAGNRSTGTAIITVTDTTAPVIGSVTVAPIGVWPPNHKMVAAPSPSTLPTPAILTPHAESSPSAATRLSTLPVTAIRRPTGRSPEP